MWWQMELPLCQYVNVIHLYLNHPLYPIGPSYWTQDVSAESTFSRGWIWLDTRDVFRTPLALIDPFSRRCWSALPATHRNSLRRCGNSEMGAAGGPLLWLWATNTVVYMGKHGWWEWSRKGTWDGEPSKRAAHIWWGFCWSHDCSQMAGMMNQGMMLRQVESRRQQTCEREAFIARNTSSRCWKWNDVQALGMMGLSKACLYQICWNGCHHCSDLWVTALGA